MAEQLANLPTFYIEGEEVERVDSFTYLGREITSSDDDFPACLRNLAKAKAKWGALSRVLKGKGASARYRSRIYLIVVSTVLLYGSETWVVTDRMRRVLEAFHHGCARHITRKYIHRVSDGEGGDEFWVYPSTAMVLKEACLKPIMDYITEHRQVFHDNFLRFSPRFAAFKEPPTLGSSHGTTTNNGQLARKMLNTQSSSRGYLWYHGDAVPVVNGWITALKYSVRRAIRLTKIF